MAKNDIQQSIGEVNKGIDSIIFKINVLDKSILETSKNARENFKGVFDIKTPNGVNEFLNENRILTEKLTKEVKEQKEENIKLEKAVKRLQNVRAQSNKKTSDEIVNQRLLARNAGEYSVISSKLSTAYEKQSKRLNVLRRRYKGVALSQGENSKEARKLLREVTTLDRRLKRVDASAGQFQRSVANYGKAWGGVTSLVRSAVGAFGIYSGLQISREIFNEVKELDAMNKALKAVTGTTEEFNKQKQFLKTTSENYGVEIKSLTKEYTKFLAGLKGTNLEGQRGQKVFDSVVKTSAALGRSQEETSGILNAMTQIISKGTVQAEELRGQLGDRLPGAFNIMARAIGVSVEELNKMLQRGEVIADEVLPKFAEEMEKTFGIENTNRVETLVGAQNRLSNAWTGYVESLNEGNGVLSKTIIGFFDLGSNIFKLITPIKNLSKEIKNEQIELNTLVNRITDVNTSNEDRTRLIDGLKVEYPAFLKFLNSEKTDNESLSTALNEVNELYIKRIALQTQQEKIEKLLKKSGDEAFKLATGKVAVDRELSKINSGLLKNSLDLTNKSYQERIDLVTNALNQNAKFSKNQRTGVVTSLNDEAIALRGLQKLLINTTISKRDAGQISKELSNEELLLKEIEIQLGATLDDLNKIFGVNTKETDKNTKRTKENNEVRKMTVGQIKEVIRLKKEELELATTREEAKKTQEEIKLLEKELNMILGVKKARESLGKLKTIDTVSFGIRSQDDIEKEGKIIAERIKKAFEGGISDQKIELDDFLNTEGITISMQALSHELGTNYEDLMSEFSSLYERDYDNFLEFQEKKLQSEEELKKQREQLAREFAQEAVNLTNAIFDNRIQRIDDDIQRNNDYYATLLDNEALTEQERSALEAERDRKNAQLEKRRREEHRKQAIFNKATAAAESITNTAIAITKTLRDGGFLAIPLTAAIAAIGAAQLATILAQPIPRYEKGKFDNYEGLAIWGEKRKEVKVSKDGNIEISPNKPTFTHVKKDDTIYPSLDDFAKRTPNFDYGDIGKAALMASISNQNAALNAFDLGKTFDKHLSGMKNEVKEGVKEGLKGFKNKVIINNNTDFTFPTFKSKKYEV